MRDEGVIKFECAWNSGPLPGFSTLPELFEFRNRLFDEGLIGVYPDGIGFGNISVRVSSEPPQFLISASQTGHIAQAHADHFSLVTQFDVQHNRVECLGPIKASSESLTHAMIYEIFPQTQAVIHVHSNFNWQRLQGVIPTSAANVPYGTPEMALEVQRLAREESLGHKGIFVMAGHEDGILSFGESLSEAHAVLRRWLTVQS